MAWEQLLLGWNTKSTRQANATEIFDFEKKWGVVFPKDFARFLTNFGAARIPIDIVHTRIPISPGHFLDLSEIGSIANEFADRLPKLVFAFNEDGIKNNRTPICKFYFRKRSCL